VTVTGATTRVEDESAAPRRGRLGLLTWDKGVVVLLVLTFAVGSVVQPDFAAPSNVSFILQDIGEVFLIAMPISSPGSGSARSP
jgi:hypothetical protein